MIDVVKFRHLPFGVVDIVATVVKVLSAKSSCLQFNTLTTFFTDILLLLTLFHLVCPL